MANRVTRIYATKTRRFFFAKILPPEASAPTARAAA